MKVFKKIILGSAVGMALIGCAANAATEPDFPPEILQSFNGCEMAGAYLTAETMKNAYANNSISPIEYRTGSKNLYGNLIVICQESGGNTTPPTSDIPLTEKWATEIADVKYHLLQFILNERFIHFEDAAAVWVCILPTTDRDILLNDPDVFTPTEYTMLNSTEFTTILAATPPCSN